MSTIVTRAGKGDTLSWTEVDNNFTNLNTDKIQSSNAGTTGQVLTKTAGGAEWANASGGSLSVICFQFSSAAQLSGSTYQAAVTELIDNANIASTGSTYNFTLPSGTYMIFWQTHKFSASGQDSNLNSAFTFTSVSGDADITDLGAYVTAEQTASTDQSVWCSDKAFFTLTQTSTYKLTWTRVLTATNNMYPRLLTLLKVA